MRNQQATIIPVLCLALISMLRLQRILRSSKTPRHPAVSSHLMSPPRARPQPGLPLPDELVEEVFTRLPPDDPALLVRTALVCKDWCRLISGPGFRRQFRRFHRKPPLLGYFHCHTDFHYFTPTSSFHLPHAIRSGWGVIDARHGRVLILNDIFSRRRQIEREFIVWDPTTDGQLRLPIPPFNYACWNAALICVAAGCDHSDCPWGPFLVILVCEDREEGKGMLSASVYSSEQGAWRDPISVHLHDRCGVYVKGTNVIVRNAFYFGGDNKIGVFKYDSCKQELSTIGIPSLCYGHHFVLMTAENGGLGFATAWENKLWLWSRVAGLGGHATWAQQRVIELDKLSTPYVCTVGIDDDVGVVFIWAGNDLFTIDLRANDRVEEVGNIRFAFGVVPYTNFCTPALGAAFRGEES